MSENNRFDKMIENCLEHAMAAKERGQRIVGIMCEYTPREIIMAAGAVPVCLCGGSFEMAAAGERDLPAGLCPLIKSTYGYHCTKSNPFLEMADLIVAETTCDGKKKMYELMAQEKQMYVLELPQKPNDSDAQKYWLKELYKFKSLLEQQFSTSISDGDLQKAITAMNHERSLRRALAEKMKLACPPWSGRRLLDYKSIISGVESDHAEYERLITMQPQDLSLANRPRVLLTGVPTVHGAEKVVDIIENAGGLIVCMENCTGIKPIMEDVELSGDPMQAIARKYFHLPCSVMTDNKRRVDSLRQLAGEFRADCVIDLVWQGCLTYDVESYFVKQLADELGLPYLKIVTDYSPSDNQRIALRVEALFETVRQQ